MIIGCPRTKIMVQNPLIMKKRTCMRAKTKISKSSLFIRKGFEFHETNMIFELITTSRVRRGLFTEFRDVLRRAEKMVACGGRHSAAAEGTGYWAGFVSASRTRWWWSRKLGLHELRERDSCRFKKFAGIRTGC